MLFAKKTQYFLDYKPPSLPPSAPLPLPPFPPSLVHLGDCLCCGGPTGLLHRVVQERPQGSTQATTLGRQGGNAGGPFRQIRVKGRGGWKCRKIHKTLARPIYMKFALGHIPVRQTHTLDRYRYARPIPWTDTQYCTCCSCASSNELGE